MDAWPARNYQDYAAVTAHWINANWQHNSKVLDVAHLSEPIHSGEYLAEKLLEVTDSYGVTKAIFTVTRDNTSVNTVMLKKLKSVAAEGEECGQQQWPFTVREGDVRCMAHIINLAVQAALRTFRADPETDLNKYHFAEGCAKSHIRMERTDISDTLLKLCKHV